MSLTDLIREAQKLSGQPYHVPSILNHMLYGPVWNKLISDSNVLRDALRSGCEKPIRDLLKSVRDIIEDSIASTSKEQLNLWPEGLHRQIVGDVDRAAVFVPSRDEFVPLEPHAISPIEVVEAGEFLIRQGRDTVRRGRRLVRLGNLRGWTQ